MRDNESLSLHLEKKASEYNRVQVRACIHGTYITELSQVDEIDGSISQYLRLLKDNFCIYHFII